MIGSNTNNNLFVWEGDIVTMEIHRRNNRPLHDEGIVYLEFKDKYTEIFSVGKFLYVIHNMKYQFITKLFYMVYLYNLYNVQF